MKDPITLAYINMFAVLRDLERLCELDAQAAALASPKEPIAISFNVAGGPQATLHFADGVCQMTPGLSGDIKLKLASPADFNQMIDGLKQPTPYGGLLKLKFLLKNFTGLTDILSTYLKAAPEALEDRAFFEKSTAMLFYLVANALSVVGNYDEKGRIASAAIPDGSISLEITGGPAAEILVRDGHMTTYARRAENPRAYMIFHGYDVARGLFDGSVDAMSALAAGALSMKGYIPMIDNLNKILGRVAIYLG